MSPSRHALRCSSVLALAVCVLAQLAGSVHSAAVRHVACEEHGGLVELHGTAVRSAARSTQHTAIAASELETHHAHCDLSATPRSTAASLGPFFTSIAAPSRTATVADLVAAATALARFRLAPKGSPPVDLATV